MSEMRTEEEQVAAIKGWWKENGKSLVVAVAIALAGVFGWKAWQQKQMNDAEAASILYQNLIQAASVSIQGKQADDIATTNHLGAQLKEEYSSTEYARFAALLLARVATDQQDFDLAMSELDWVLAHEPSEEMKNITLMRKAQVFLAKDDVESGLVEINKISNNAFDAAALELKGDLLLAKGDKAGARASYEQALNTIGDSGNRQLLSVKLDDLATGQEG